MRIGSTLPDGRGITFNSPKRHSAHSLRFGRRQSRDLQRMNTEKEVSSLTLAKVNAVSVREETRGKRKSKEICRDGAVRMLMANSQQAFWTRREKGTKNSTYSVTSYQGRNHELVQI